MILGSGPTNYIWIIIVLVHWRQRMYQAIIQDLWLQFSQTGSHFLQNHKMNFEFLFIFETVLFKVRDIFSFICFLKSFPRIFSSFSVSNWSRFFLLMHWFNKDTISHKQEKFSEDALRSFLSRDSLFGSF